MPTRIAPASSTVLAAARTPARAPGPARVDEGPHDVVQFALALGIAVLDAHRPAAATALAFGPGLGDIDLPPDAPADSDPTLLAPLGPLYLAHELESAGLLRTAELMAGLFASGVVQQPLGASGARMAAFWQQRRSRLDAEERRHILGQVFAAPAFYRAMQTLCESLVALTGDVGLDGRPVPDVRHDVALQESAQALRSQLAPHAGGMAAYAARGILESLKEAVGFLRERDVQAAFGARDLWGLVATVGAARGVSAAEVRARVDLGRAGAIVIGWLVSRDAATRVDAGSPNGQTIAAAAQRWLMARQRLADGRRDAAATPVDEAREAAA